MKYAEETYGRAIGTEGVSSVTMPKHCASLRYKGPCMDRTLESIAPKEQHLLYRVESLRLLNGVQASDFACTFFVLFYNK